MIKSGNIKWGREIYPQLPDEIIAEIMEMLGSLHPRAVWSSDKPSDCNYDGHEPRWCFPFIDIPEDFDQTEWDQWTDMVENDIMERYNIPENKLTWIAQ